MRLTTAHCMFFGLVCLWPTTCSQAGYVMWGGLNIMPSLLTQWVVVCSIVKKFQLHRQTPLHPVWIAGISGFVFWLGNMQMVVGKDAYVAAWMRAATEWLLGLPAKSIPGSYWEEMAIFHLFGIWGNHILYGAYEWVALQERTRELHLASQEKASGTREGGSPTNIEKVPSTAEALSLSNITAPVPASLNTMEGPWLAELLHDAASKAHAD